MRGGVRAAEERGFHTLLLSTRVQGEAKEIARFLTAMAKEIAASNRPVARPACLIAGGETTVTVRGQGKGGGTQELALAAALDLGAAGPVPGAAETVPIVVLSGGTDGTDGPTDAAARSPTPGRSPRRRNAAWTPGLAWRTTMPIISLRRWAI